MKQNIDAMANASRTIVIDIVASSKINSNKGSFAKMLIANSKLEKKMADNAPNVFTNENRGHIVLPRKNNEVENIVMSKYRLAGLSAKVL